MFNPINNVLSPELERARGIFTIVDVEHKGAVNFSEFVELIELLQIRLPPGRAVQLTFRRLVAASNLAAPTTSSSMNTSTSALHQSHKPPHHLPPTTATATSDAVPVSTALPFVSLEVFIKWYEAELNGGGAGGDDVLTRPHTVENTATATTPAARTGSTDEHADSLLQLVSNAAGSGAMNAQNSNVSPTTANNTNNTHAAEQPGKSAAAPKLREHQTSIVFTDSPKNATLTKDNSSASMRSSTSVTKLVQLQLPVTTGLGDVFDHAVKMDPTWASIRSRGIEEVVFEVLQYGYDHESADIKEVWEKVLVKYLREEEADLRLNIPDGVASTARGSGNLTKAERERSLQAFASALTLHHMSTGVDALWQVQAAVIFVDISGYSSVAHVLGDRGPHVFAGVVNTYLDVIVTKVREFGGDVVKFAGDALMAMWFSDRPVNNARAATSCAMGLLQDCGSYPVPDTELTFGLHVGIAAGTVISHVFAPRATSLNQTMPSHFHFLTGDPVPAVSVACDAAKRGEIVTTEEARTLCGDSFVRTDTTSKPGYFRVMEVPAPYRSQLPEKMQDLELSSQVMPPPILSRVEAGINPFYLAEMRDLVVLFISRASQTDEQIWFDEVFHVLSQESCSVVQIIDDDKGVHIVAAFNLYVMHDDSADKSIRVAGLLRAKHSGCFTGAAAGSVLCGVLGARDACQWDITGGACVRACRLMQHAQAHGYDVVFDESIFQEAKDRSRLVKQDSITVKGSSRPVDVYTMRHIEVADGSKRNRRMSGLGSMERAPGLFFTRLCPEVHKTLVDDIAKYIQFRQTLDKHGNRSAHRAKKPKDGFVSIGGDAVVESSNLSHAQLNSQLSFRGSGAVPSFRRRRSLTEQPQNEQYQNQHRGSVDTTRSDDMGLAEEDSPNSPHTSMAILVGAPGTGKHSICHNAIRGAGLVPVVHTASDDRTNVELDILNTLGQWFRTHHSEGLRTRAAKTVEALRLVQYHVAFKLGVEMLERALETGFRCAIIVRHGHFLDHHSIVFMRTIAERFTNHRDIFLMVTVSPQYHNPHPEEVFQARWGTVIANVEEATENEIRALTEFELGGVCHSSLHSVVLDRSARFVECAVEMIRYMTQHNLTVRFSGKISLTKRGLQELKETPWQVLSPTVKKKCIHEMDHLPPYLQTTTKIICAITEQPGISAFFYSVNRVCELMLGHELRVPDVELLQSLFILRMCEHKCTSHTGGGELDAAVFYIPAMRDVLQSTLVPQQRAQINRICAEAYAETHPMDHPMQFLVRARHSLFCCDYPSFLKDMQVGWALIDKLFPDVEATSTTRTNLHKLYVTWLMRHPDFSKDLLYKTLVICLEDGDRLARTMGHGGRVSNSQQSVAMVNAVRQHAWARDCLATLSLKLGPAREYMRTVLLLVATLNDSLDNARENSDLIDLEMVPVEVVRDLRVALEEYAAVLRSSLLSLDLHGKVVDAATSRVHRVLETMLNDHFLDQLSTAADRVAAMTNEDDQDLEKQKIMTMLDEVNRDLREYYETTLTQLVDFLAQRCFLDDMIVMISDSSELLPDFGVDEIISAMSKNNYAGSAITVTALYERLPLVYQKLCPQSQMLQRSLFDALRVMYEGLHLPLSSQGSVRDDFAVFLALFLAKCVEVHPPK
eukprot:PhM_4_TR6263/c0_g1_i1/m.75940